MTAAAISPIPTTPPTTPLAMTPTFILLPEKDDDLGIRLIEVLITKALVEVGEAEIVDWACVKVNWKKEDLIRNRRNPSIVMSH